MALRKITPTIAPSEAAPAATDIPLRRPDIMPPLRRRLRPCHAAVAAQEPAAAPEPMSVPEKPNRRRGHAVKNEQGKWQPTGDEGFAAPPERYRFKKGNPGGPGRRKGSKNHDAILKKQFNRRRNVRMDGRNSWMTTHELLVASEFNLALKGDRQARKTLLAEGQRLSREQSGLASEGDGAEATSLTPAGAAILEWYKEEVIRGQAHPLDEPEPSALDPDAPHDPAEPDGDRGR